MACQAAAHLTKMASPGHLRREPFAMTFSLVSALRQIRDDLADRLEPLALGDLCRSRGCRWRERILDPVTTIHLFILPILHRNTAWTHRPRLTGLVFTASAYCQARSRLPLAVLQALLQ